MSLQSVRSPTQSCIRQAGRVSPFNDIRPAWTDVLACRLQKRAGFGRAPQARRAHPSHNQLVHTRVCQGGEANAEHGESMGPCSPTACRRGPHGWLQTQAPRIRGWHFSWGVRGFNSFQGHSAKNCQAASSCWRAYATALCGGMLPTNNSPEGRHTWTRSSHWEAWQLVQLLCCCLSKHLRGTPNPCRLCSPDLLAQRDTTWRGLAAGLAFYRPLPWHDPYW